MTNTNYKKLGRTTEEPMTWALEPLVKIPHVIHAVVLTADGLVVGRSPDLERTDAEGAAAMLSTVQASTRTMLAAFIGSAREVRLRQVVAESTEGYAFITDAGEHTILAVYTDLDVDLGVVAEAVQIQVKRLGQKVMSAAPRQQAEDAVS